MLSWRAVKRMGKMKLLGELHVTNGPAPHGVIAGLAKTLLFAACLSMSATLLDLAMTPICQRKRSARYVARSQWAWPKKNVIATREDCQDDGGLRPLDIRLRSPQGLGRAKMSLFRDLRFE